MKTILLVGFNDESRMHITEVLQMASYTIVHTRTGREAVGVAVREHPDLVMCSMESESFDAYGLLRMLNSNRATSGIPCILYGVFTAQSEIRRAMESGADDVLERNCSDAGMLGAVSARLLRFRDRNQSGERHNDVSLGEKLHDSVEHDSSFVRSNVSDGIDVSLLQKHGRMKRFKKNETIYTEESTPHAVYYLVRGKIKTYRTHELGKEYITGLYAEGQFFGHIAALEDKVHTDAARALDESDIIVVPNSEFLTVLLHSAVMSQRFLRMLADELDSKDDSLVKLAYNSVRKRVADALLSLERQYHVTPDPFHITISRENLANLAGTATETTIRTLHDFKEEKLIDIKGSTIQILNLEKLKSMRN